MILDTQCVVYYKPAWNLNPIVGQKIFLFCIHDKQQDTYNDFYAYLEQNSTYQLKYTCRQFYHVVNHKHSNTHVCISTFLEALSLDLKEAFLKELIVYIYDNTNK